MGVDHASPPGIGKIERLRDCAGLSGRCAEVLALVILVHDKDQDKANSLSAHCQFDETESLPFALGTHSSRAPSTTVSRSVTSIVSSMWKENVVR